MKYLLLEFEGAKFFPNKNYSKDIISEFKFGGSKGSTMKRKFQESFNEPITVNQISNMLHVLFGERPVPSFRYVPYSKVDHIFEMAENSYMKILTIKKHNEKKGTDEYVNETRQMRNSSYNSNVKSIVVYWEKIKQYFDNDDLYHEFIDITSDALNEKDIIRIPFHIIRNLIIDSNNPDLFVFIDKLKHSNMKGLYDFLTIKSNAGGGINVKRFSDRKRNRLETPRLLRLNNLYPEKVVSLSGQIYCPISDDQLDKLVRTTAKLLDGGLVNIVDVVDENWVSLDEDFIMVGDISTKKE